jgi:hypothetical protein
MVAKERKPSKFEQIDNFLQNRSIYGYGLEVLITENYYQWYTWKNIASYLSELTDIPVSSTTLRRWAKAGGWELRRDN